MNRTPAEIWTEIFTYACTDSGTTGRRLSLVSKFIRESSAPVKLQSISVHGLQQIKRFYQLLKNTPPHLRRVRYLYMSTLPPPPTRHGLARFVPSRKAIQVGQIGMNEVEQLCQTCPCVVAEVAGSVEVLYLDVSAYYLRISPSTTFPRLTNLTSDGFPLHYYDTEDDEPDPVLCPQLRRWHIIGYPETFPRISRNDNFSVIAIIAPSITHLRFSGIQKETFFAEDLETALGLATEVQGEALHVERLPKNIQRVYVKPGPSPSGDTRISYANLMARLRQLNRSNNRFILLKAYKKADTITCTSNEWLGFINGGEGCWSLHERVSA